MSVFKPHFADPAFVDRYLRQGPPAFSPGHAGLMQMTGVLLAERAPDDATVLVVGAGGGLETREMASRHPGWRFVGVDPSPQMLDLARATAGPVAGDRLTLIEGVVADAPPGPFDAATCIFVLGIVPDRGGKLELLSGVHARLKPGAPFVLADQCMDRTAPDFGQRIDRYVAYARASGVDEDMLDKARTGMAANASLATRERNEALLAEAGFSGVEVVYRGMAWVGWVAYA